jgi:hypothetical protein
VSTATVTAPPSLRAVILDALHTAYWAERGEIEDCAVCRRHPAGVCADPDHQDAHARTAEYEEARKRIEFSPGDAEVLAVCGIEGGDENE